MDISSVGVTVEEVDSVRVKTWLLVGISRRVCVAEKVLRELLLERKRVCVRGMLAVDDVVIVDVVDTVMLLDLVVVALCEFDSSCDAVLEGELLSLTLWLRSALPVGVLGGDIVLDCVEDVVKLIETESVAEDDAETSAEPVLEGVSVALDVREYDVERVSVAVDDSLL